MIIKINKKLVRQVRIADLWGMRLPCAHPGRTATTTPRSTPISSPGALISSSPFPPSLTFPCFLLQIPDDQELGPYIRLEDLSLAFSILSLGKRNITSAMETFCPNLYLPSAFGDYSNTWIKGRSESLALIYVEFYSDLKSVGSFFLSFITDSPAFLVFRMSNTIKFERHPVGCIKNFAVIGISVNIWETDKTFAILLICFLLKIFLLKKNKWDVARRRKQKATVGSQEWKMDSNQ